MNPESTNSEILFQENKHFVFERVNSFLHFCLGILILKQESVLSRLKQTANCIGKRNQNSLFDVMSLLSVFTFST